MLAQAQRLVLVGRRQTHTIYPVWPSAQPLEPHLERRLAIVDHERHLASPHLHNNLRAENAPVAEPESGIEEPRVMSADLPGARVVDDHLGRELRWHPDSLL